MNYHFRQASEADRMLLWDIQRTCIGPYVNKTFKTTIEYQREYFDRQCIPEKYLIIEIEKKPAGFFCSEVREDHVYLANIALLPDYQSQGIGSRIIRSLMSIARRRCLPIRLKVLKSNPAIQLYRRLGFKCYDETETHYWMQWGS